MGMNVKIAVVTGGASGIGRVPAPTTPSSESKYHSSREIEDTSLKVITLSSNSFSRASLHVPTGEKNDSQ